MKRFILLAGTQYYPNGGFLDYKAQADSVEEVRRLIRWDYCPQAGCVFRNKVGSSYRGGWVDPKGVHSDIETINITFQVGEDSTGDSYSWYMIVDLEAGKIAEMYSSYGIDARDSVLPVEQILTAHDIWGDVA